MDKMKARVLTAVGNLEMKEVDIPAIKSGEVLMRVRACGICGSDIPRIFTTGTYHFPTIPGHEFAGEVVAAFDEQDKKYIGKNCAVFPLIPCRECANCKTNTFELCSNYNYLGSRCDGAFAEYVAVPSWNLVPMPEGVSFDKAAMAEPVAVALHALKQAGGIEIGDNVVIYGPGTIGLIMAQWAKVMGAAKVMLVGGTNKKNVDFIKNTLGFEDYYTGELKDAAEWVMAKTNNLGADVAIEAVGSADSLCNCLNTARAAGKVICVGNPKSDMLLPKDTYWKILRKQLKLYGTWNSSYNETDKNDWVLAVEAMANGQMENDKLITHKFSLEEMDKGLQIMKDRTDFYKKIIINP